MPTTQGGSLLNVSVERQPLDLAAEGDLAVNAEADDVEDFLADIDADRGKRRCGGVHGLLLRLMRSSLGRLLRRGKQPVHPISGASFRFRTDQNCHKKTAGDSCSCH